MQQRIDVGLGRARLWRDETPVARYHATRWIEQEVVPVIDRSGVRSAIVAVEVWFPTGPRSLYGLLGGRFDTDGSARSAVRVAVGIDDGPRLIDTIAGAADEVRVGLAPEYADAVAEWSARAGALMRLPAGTLTLDCAAHGIVGSNRNVFSALAVLVVEMLVERFDERDPTEVGAVVRKAIMRGAHGWLEDLVKAAGG